MTVLYGFVFSKSGCHSFCVLLGFFSFLILILSLFFSFSLVLPLVSKKIKMIESVLSSQQPAEDSNEKTVKYFLLNLFSFIFTTLLLLTSQLCELLVSLLFFLFLMFFADFRQRSSMKIGKERGSSTGSKQETPQCHPKSVRGS